MKLLIALLAVSLVSGTTSWGRCPKVALQANFDITKYMGTWYELVRSSDMKFEQGDCNKAQYSLNQDGTVLVVNSEIVSGVSSNVTGSAYCDADVPAQCYVSFSKSAPAGDYEVFSTDYTSYAIVYSCSSLIVAHLSWVWVLAREQNFDFNTVMPFVAQLGFQTSGLRFTSQTNCPANT